MEETNQHDPKLFWGKGIAGFKSKKHPTKHEYSVPKRHSATAPTSVIVLAKYLTKVSSYLLK